MINNLEIFMKQQTPFFITITSEVLRDKDLNPIEKLIFTEIMALTYSCGYCYASNSHFAEIFDRTPETISRNISNLQAIANNIADWANYRNFLLGKLDIPQILNDKMIY